MTTKTTLATALAALVLGAPMALAQDFPNRPIEIVVTYAAGGTTDVIARVMAQHLPRFLPNPVDVIVSNTVGGGGTIGMTQVSNAPADGYTLAFTTSSPISLQPLYGNTPFTIDSFEPVAGIFEVATSLNVHDDSEIRTVEDLVEWIRANPGQFTYASTGGNGSGTHLVAERFASIFGLDMRHIPFEGTAQLTAAVTGKQIMGSNQLPNVHQGGSVRPIVFLTEARPTDPMYLDIPTTAELGIDAVTSFFAGLFAPAGTPVENIQILNDAIAQVLEVPEVAAVFEAAGVPVVFQDHESFDRIVRVTSETNREQLVALGLIDG